MKLFEPITVRGMTLKNRIVMPPMLVGVGFRSPRARAYYGERARGGVGAVITAGTSVDLFVSDDARRRPGGVASFLEALRLLADEVHGAGAKIGAQLWHGNTFPAGSGLGDSRGVPVAPSPRDNMRALTKAEIQAIVTTYANAAVKVREGGFDFVELHGAHGYLMCQFFSPADNRRNDEYGGNLEGRMRFGLDCVRATRAAVGPDYPIFFRIGAWEDRPGGITTADSARFAAELEKAGVDVMDVSVGHLPGPTITNHPSADQPQGTFVHLAELIKKAITIPVIAVGRINRPEVAEAVVAEGRADLVAIGRQLIADPYWAQKAESGRWDEIRPCLSCNTCFDSGYRGVGLCCAVNPEAGKELESRLTPAPQKKRVLVVGGGPGGMEAATVAARRGHQVTLCEKDDRLGGQLLLAAIPPHKEAIAELNRQMAGQLQKAGVEVKLKCKATPDSIAQAKPDAVVVAAGSAPLVPEIPGVKGKKVVGAIEVLSGKARVGHRVVVLGGELVGCEVADYLAAQGKNVTITRRGPQMAVNLPSIERENLLGRLAQQGVTMLPGVKYEEITAQGLVITDKEGKKRTLEADTIVLAAGATPLSELAQKIKGKVAEVHSVGDCVQPRKIAEAIEEGARVGRQL